jgi:hypothetical protein
MAGLSRFSTERPAESESVAEPGQSGLGAATRERFLEGEGEKAFWCRGGVSYGLKPDNMDVRPATGTDLQYDLVEPSGNPF